MSGEWIAPVGALLGVLLGGGIGVGHALLQRRWDSAREEARIQQTRRDEVRARMDLKADEILKSLADVQAILGRHVIISRVHVWADADIKATVRDLLSQIAVDSGYLTQPLRDHVRVVTRIVPDAERLAGEGWVDTSARQVTYVAIWWARRCLERYLRGETVPADRGEPIDTYLRAWNELQDMIEHDVSAAEGDGPTALPSGSDETNT